MILVFSWYCLQRCSSELAELVSLSCSLRRSIYVLIVPVIFVLKFLNVIKLSFSTVSFHIKLDSFCNFKHSGDYQVCDERVPISKKQKTQKAKCLQILKCITLTYT